MTTRTNYLLLPVLNSAANPRFKQLKKLISSRRERKQTGLMVLDGIHLLHSALDNGWQLDECFLSESGLAKPEIANWLAEVKPHRVSVFSDALFNQLTELNSQTGIMATTQLPDGLILDLTTNPDLLLLDGVQDPGNVGSILRTAAAAGVVDVVLSAQCADPWSIKVLRAGMGAHFGLRLYLVESLVDVLGQLPNAYQRIVTSLSAQQSLYSLDLMRPNAWVVGSEGAGVSEAVMQVCETSILIPMAGKTESLNVGAATAICLFEQRRQRLS